MVNGQSQDTPAWLETIEQNSWQIEVLISGGLLYTLFSLPENINEHLLKTIITSELNDAHFIFFMSAFLVSKALLIGFGVNLFLRAIWLAYIGVHFSFPTDIEDSSPEFTEFYRDKLSTENNTLSKIIQLESWASLSYSLSILLSVLFFGAVLMVLFISFLIQDLLIPLDETFIQVVYYGFFALSLLISFGLLESFLFRKLRLERSWLFHLIRVLSIVNLSFLFRREWRVISSNISKWKIYTVVFIYLLLSILLSMNDIQGTSMSMPIRPFDARDNRMIAAADYRMDNDEYDEHLRPHDIIGDASIPSEVIRGGQLPIFIAYDEYHDRIINFYRDSLKIAKDYSSIVDTSNQVGTVLTEQREKLTYILDRVFQVIIDGEAQDSMFWMYRNHPITDQEGWFTVVDISALDHGRHTLDLRRQDMGSSVKGIFRIRWIPFWVDKNVR